MSVAPTIVMELRVPGPPANYGGETWKTLAEFRIEADALVAWKVYQDALAALVSSSGQIRIEEH
jgi:hypothetical protein